MDNSSNNLPARKTVSAVGSPAARAASTKVSLKVSFLEVSKSVSNVCFTSCTGAPPCCTWPTIESISKSIPSKSIWLNMSLPCDTSWPSGFVWTTFATFTPDVEDTVISAGFVSGGSFGFVSSCGSGDLGFSESTRWSELFRESLEIVETRSSFALSLFLTNGFQSYLSDAYKAEK